jgi:hypothetical protein
MGHESLVLQAHLKQRSWVLLYVAKWWHWGKWPNSLCYFPILFSRAISQKFHATPFTCMTWRLPSVNGASGSSTLKFILLWYPYYFYSNFVLLLLTLFCTNIATSYHKELSFKKDEFIIIIIIICKSNK